MKVPLHVIQARRREMADWMLRRGHVAVSEVCAQFRVSEATARRDLAALAAENWIVRTYGGALTEYNQRFASFRERLKTGVEAKRKIARQARRRIAPQMTIFLDAGTTPYALAEELQRDPITPLTVVTNSLPVAELLSTAAEVRLHLLGGEVLPRQSVLIGKAARKAVDFYQIDVAFLGLLGANEEGLWNSQEEVVAVQKRLLETAKSVVFCIDATKLGKTGPAFLSPWSTRFTLATDATPRQREQAGVPRT